MTINNNYYFMGMVSNCNYISESDIPLHTNYLLHIIKMEVCLASHVCVIRVDIFVYCKKNIFEQIDAKHTKMTVPDFSLHKHFFKILS